MYGPTMAFDDSNDYFGDEFDDDYEEDFLMGDDDYDLPPYSYDDSDYDGFDDLEGTFYDDDDYDF